MNSTLFRRTAVAVLVFSFPIAALADISGTVTLAANTALNLDTGATASSGGDILWTGSGINFQGSAKGGTLAAVGLSGASGFSTVTPTILQELASFATTTPIPASALPVGTIVALSTNGGNSSKVLVTALSSTSITLQYTTYETTAPTITKVTNNYSYTPNGFTNSGISPSTIFTIFGANLAAAPSGNLTLNSSAGPAGLPTTDAGATLSVTVGGTTVHPAMYYASPTQIAAVLPAATPVGSGTLTVNYNGGTASATIQVVPAALGLDTYYGTGSGLITATSATTGALYNYTNSAPPGQIVVFWGSGSGPDPQDSDTVFTTSPHAVNQSSTQFWIGNVQATVFYAGSSGYPGVMQYNVQIPSNAPNGCWVSVAAVVNGVTSNFGALPVQQGGGPCIDSLYGITGTQIGMESEQVNVSSGSIFLFQATAPGNTAGTTNVNAGASAHFQQVTGSSFGSSSGLVSIPGCTVTETATGGVTATATGLDAGTITVTNPTGTQVTLTSQGSESSSLAGFYEAQLAAGFIPSSGGTFTFSGSGGANVGPFTASLTFPNPPLVWTNQSAAATVTRSSGLTVNWTGGTAGTYVIISGSASSSAGVSGMYTCLAPVSAQTFTVPTFVLDTLPSGTGNTMVENSTNFVTFSATGISSGIGFGGASFQVNTNYN